MLTSLYGDGFLRSEVCPKLHASTYSANLFGRATPVQRSAISHARLMRESTDRVESALRSGDAKENFIAHRILENTSVFASWELEHSGLMRPVSEFRQLRNQAAALRQTALRLIHGKALFEYLKTLRSPWRGAREDPGAFLSDARV